MVLFTMIYWLIVIFGLIDIDTVDIDLDIDADIDMDVDSVVDVDVDIDGGAGGVVGVLSFFNIGHMPLMIFLSFFSIPFWALTILLNDYLSFGSLLLQIPLLIGAFIASLFIAKFLTTPIAKFYRNIRKHTEAVNVIGQVCTAKLPITSDRSGQAEIKSSGSSVLINARTRDGLVINKGESALVIEFEKTENYYFVEPYQL